MEGDQETERVTLRQTKRTWDAVVRQANMIKEHIRRIREKRDRYEPYSLARNVVELELAYWTELNLILEANLEGKTVSPS